MNSTEPAETQPVAPRRRWRGVSAALTTALAISLALLFVLAGLAPPRFNPFAPPNLNDPQAWFLDARLARLRRDRSACARALTPPIIIAKEIADRPLIDGCGWLNAVRVAEVAGARLAVEALTCEMAGAMAMWVAHVVQPAARKHFGSPVASIQSLGVYACRNIAGSRLLSKFRSQHATANALDVAGVTLADGRRITVKAQWTSNEPAAGFLRDIHDGACRYFRVVLGPNYNAAHHDHFHFDRGRFRTCK